MKRSCDWCWFKRSAPSGPTGPSRFPVINRSLPRRCRSGSLKVWRSRWASGRIGWLPWRGVPWTRDTPRAPATSYGYIHRREALDLRGAEAGAPPAFRVESFKEKPSRETAEGYVKSGEYYWSNSNVKRSLYMDNYLYTVSGRYVKANYLDSLAPISSVQIGEATAAPVYYE